MGVGKVKIVLTLDEADQLCGLLAAALTKLEQDVHRIESHGLADDSDFVEYHKRNKSLISAVQPLHDRIWMKRCDVLSKGTEA